MEKVILKKVNGVVSKSAYKSLVSKQAYLEKNENGFSNIIGQNTGDFHKKDVESISGTIHAIIEEILTVEAGTSIMDRLYNYLKLAQTKDELLNTVDLLLKSYKQVLELQYVDKRRNNTNGYSKENVKIIKNFDKQLKTNPELLISIAIKKIIYTYYCNSILQLGEDKINELESLKINGVSIDIMLGYLDETFDKTSIDNGTAELSRKIFYDAISIVSQKVEKHLCWENCENASVLKCQKIYDKVKKEIGEYNFITDGYQTFDTTGKMDRFIITRCKNYRMVKPKKLTAEDIKRIKMAKDGLRMAYFGADSLREAYEIQSELEEKGLIKNIRGKELLKSIDISN